MTDSAGGRAGRRETTRRGILAATTTALFALTIVGQAAGGTIAAPLPVARPDIGDAAAPEPRNVSAPRQRHTGVSGWIAVDLDSGQVIDKSNADMPFAPASVAKLPTTFYALDRLGPNFRFETRVATTGKIRGETLEGDLILIGGGDPELDTDALLPLVTQCAGRGIRHVKGHFLVDGSAGVKAGTIDAEQPVDAAYNPAVSGLNLNFNRVRLKWDARRGSRELRVSAKAERLDPEVAGVRVTLASFPDAPMFSHALEGRAEVWRMNERGLRGEGSRWLPVRQPELYAGEVFQGLARTYGLAVDPAREGSAPEGATIMARHQSRELRPMLKSMLRYSTNLTAEMVGLAASRASGQQPGSLAASAAAMNAWAAGVAGFAAGDPGFRLANHSGLSEASRVAPRRMVELLTALARREGLATAPAGQLPAAISDLLRDYNVAAKGVDIDFKHLEIAAKTGTMDYVRGLAGYIATPSGRRIAFAIFSNDLGRRQPGVSQINRGWMAQAREFERALIRSWVLRLKA